MAVKCKIDIAVSYVVAHACKNVRSIYPFSTMAVSLYLQCGGTSCSVTCQICVQ